MNLQGKKGIIMGIANQNSIAYGCADVISKGGAELAITYGKEKTRSFTEPLIINLNCTIYEQCNFESSNDLKKLFTKIKQKWGKLDFAIHSAAFAPASDLHGRVVDSSEEGFLKAMSLSCHSFIRMCKESEELMEEGGSILCMSYLGSQKVIKNYGIMGPVKAALESAVRYIADELGQKNIRVNAVSPGPIKTRALSGIKDFEQLLRESQNRAAVKQELKVYDVGRLAAFLVSDYARTITGQTIYIDNGNVLY